MAVGERSEAMKEANTVRQKRHQVAPLEYEGEGYVKIIRRKTPRESCGSTTEAAGARLESE